MVSGVGHLSGEEKTMSLYDTIRCIWHDPAYLVREHADSAIAILPIIAFFIVWAAL